MTSTDDPNLTVHTSFDQGSEAWFEARRGIVTASVVGSMITPKTVQPSNNQTSRGLITTLAAERITGHVRSEEHTSELQSRGHLVCRLLLEKKKQHENNL